MKLIDESTVTVAINSTLGSVKRFIAHPMKMPKRICPCGTGPLEITLFLKHDMPKTDVDSSARFRIDIFP